MSVNVFGNVESNFQQIARGKAQDGTTIRFQVADGRQFRTDLGDCFQVRGEEQVVVFPDLVSIFVDRTDLRGEAKTHVDVLTFDPWNAGILGRIFKFVKTTIRPVRVFPGVL